MSEAMRKLLAGERFVWRHEFLALGLDPTDAIDLAHRFADVQAEDMRGLPGA
jgi:hypothetical protein